MLPVLSCSCEVGQPVFPIGSEGELAHRHFVRHLRGVRKSSTSLTGLAEMRYSLCRFTFGSRCHQQCCVFVIKSVLYEKTSLTYNAVTGVTAEAVGGGIAAAGGGVAGRPMNLGAFSNAGVKLGANLWQLPLQVGCMALCMPWAVPSRHTGM